VTVITADFFVRVVIVVAILLLLCGEVMSIIHSNLGGGE
jgi:hypothetical protein